MIFWLSAVRRQSADKMKAERKHFCTARGHNQHDLYDDGMTARYADRHACPDDIDLRTAVQFRESGNLKKQGEEVGIQMAYDKRGGIMLRPAHCLRRRWPAMPAFPIGLFPYPCHRRALKGLLKGMPPRHTPAAYSWLLSVSGAAARRNRSAPKPAVTAHPAVVPV